MNIYDSLPNGGISFEDARDIRALVTRAFLKSYKNYRVRLVSPDGSWEHAQDATKKLLEMVVDCAFNDAAVILGQVNEDGLLP